MRARSRRFFFSALTRLPTSPTRPSRAVSDLGSSWSLRLAAPARNYRAVLEERLCWPRPRSYSRGDHAESDRRGQNRVVGRRHRYDPIQAGLMTEGPTIACCWRERLTTEIATGAMHIYAHETIRIKVRVKKLVESTLTSMPRLWGCECGPALPGAEIAPDQRHRVKADALARPLRGQRL